MMTLHNLKNLKNLKIDGFIRILDLDLLILKITILFTTELDIS